MSYLKSLVVLVIIVLILIFAFNNFKSDDSLIKVGVITPLTGGVAYWGESTKMGIELAQKDLAEEGINVEFVIEDGQLDPKVALSSAQKLVNINGVNAIYSEFNPAAIAVSSFLKDKNVLHLYNAAPVSPLQEGQNIYKTYLDYEKSCGETASLIKNRGISKVGVLKMNLEFGDLCLSGIKNVFGENNVLVEEYNAGETDFKTHLLKIKSDDIGAVFNISFQPETLASLKNMREMGIDSTFVGLSEIISPDIIEDYSELLENSVMFGLPTVSAEFVEKINAEFPGKTVGSYQAIAQAYFHTKQMVNALDDCENDMSCVVKKMDKTKAESLIGFVGFNNHIAEFETLIQEWKGGKLVDIK
ncbi:TPA: hypothetical protein DCZ46_00985 [Candidatus Campbellbacteria bacterium]|nr:MAG: ABC-type branched-chain amino acid transport system, periplasmic component, branched-chain amino acid transport system substrate-binding protein [Candidatus Campbellbacteria bacterium GW2011_OD1_34_28]KKP75338.1 MAG: ABC transporter substrate-binding protein [Candidatus Campbellbacteria bacterium GW2011_GWD2_35_24]KKP76101.1 MAG: amino acid/amide ABC transporter substrate-binding protein, HAAT family [Candidatus Campbellbacteria bacterium GW2011_GWC2_35_28]KKP77290.1 MAG: ABC transporter